MNAGAWQRIGRGSCATTAVACAVAMSTSPALGAPDASGSDVSVRVVAVSPGWTCRDLDTRLAAMERRLRVAFLANQDPQEIFVGRPRWPLAHADRRVPDEVQLKAWRQWAVPVTVQLILRPEPTSPPETRESQPEGFGDVKVVVSSGVGHVDESAVSAVVGSGELLGGCDRNAWTLRVTFTPPAPPSEVRGTQLRKALDDPDAWVRVLAASALVRRGSRAEDVRSVLADAARDRSDRIGKAAAESLQEMLEPARADQ